MLRSYFFFILFCLSIITPSVLSLCASGNYPDSANTCQACPVAITNCKECSSDKVCTKCANGFYTKNGACTACPSGSTDHCTEVQDCYCLTCATDYYIVNGKCDQCSSPTNCKSCPVSGTCAICKDGYYLSSGSCAACGSECLECSSDSICIKCKTGFYPIAGVCTGCGGQCATCSALDTCLSCADKKYGSTCADLCIPNCITCTSATNCIKCSQGYYFDGKSCVNCVINNCFECSSALVCTICKTGYQLNSDNSQCFDCQVTNCALCYSSQICSACQDGTWLTGEKTCKTCPTGCSKCLDDLICYECLVNYHLEANKCLLCGSDPEAKCKTCATAGECSECVDSYTLSTDKTKCVACLANCKTCAYPSLECSVCNSNSLLFADKSCQVCGKDTECVKCDGTNQCKGCNEKGFLATPAAGVCTACNLGCQTCTSTSTECKTCIDGYILEGTSCKLCAAGSADTKCITCPVAGICTKCADNYFIDQNGKCVACFSNCAYCWGTAYNQCLKCVINYHLEDSRCLECGKDPEAKCKTCATAGECSECVNSYTLSTDKTKCVACLANCKTCLYPSLDCTVCNTNYLLVDKSCQLCGKDTTCVKCDGTNQCQECNEKGYLVPPDASGVCTPCPTGCQTCISRVVDGVKFTDCKTCKDDYILEGTSCKLCAAGSPDTKCISCPIAGICTKCAQNYFIDINGKCDACFSNCLYCWGTAYNQCLSCPNFFIFENGQCLKCGLNSDTKCKTCPTNSQCTSCVDGYYLSWENFCLSCPSNCKECSSSTSCTKCDGGYLLIAGSCHKCEKGSIKTNGCVVCDVTDVCTQCDESYLITPILNTCVPCPSSCKTCSEINVCTICKNGYINVSGSCVPCSETALNTNCAFCPNEGICLSCKKGYILDSDRNCVACYSGCTSCVGKAFNQCLSCAKTYILENGQCLKCGLDPNTKCKTCEVENAQCSACVDGHFLNLEKYCKKCADNCRTCVNEESNQCTSCFDDYLLLNNECIKCEADPASKSQGCVRCDRSICTFCNEENYFPIPTKEGRCLVCSVANCKSCPNNLNVCAKCKSDFFLENNACVPCTDKCATCSSDRTCQTCKSGYTLNSQSLCVPCFTGCQTCESQLATACTSCTDGYILEGNSCIKCQAGSLKTKCVSCPKDGLCEICSEGTFQSEGVCLSCASTCKTCNSLSSKDCSSCYDGFILEGNSCVRCAAGLTTTNCVECPTNGLCTKCADGFLVSGGRCLACDSKCKTCADIPTICTSCYAKFALENKYCYECGVDKSTKCSSCELGVCTNCADGYFLNIHNGKCVACNQNCKTCDGGLENSCKSCFDTYILEGTECVLCKQSSTQTKCITCASNGVCSQCQDGFFLLDKRCAACYPGCKTCTGESANQCTTCKDGFIFEYGRCFKCELGSENTKCTSCPTLGICKNCVEGYFVSNGFCATCASNCKTCKSKSSIECTSCNAGYILEQGECVLCGSANTKCKTCTDNGDCLKCVDEYFVEHNKCSRCHKGCKSCSSDLPASCLNCIDNFILEGGECIHCEMEVGIKTNCKSCPLKGECTQCADRFYLNSNRCLACHYPCKTCNSGLERGCLSCADEYILEDGKCVRCASDSPETKCTTCKLDGKCTQCIDEYFVDAGKCSKCGDDCLKCSNKNTCLECKPKSILNTNSQCVKNLENCLQASSEDPDKCATCLNGYGLTDEKICVSLISNCKEINAFMPEECKLCNEGFYLITGICVKCPKECKTCASHHTCLSCNNNFILEQGRCAKCSTSFLETSCINCAVGDVCTACDAGYYVLNGKCSKCYKGCKSCGDSTFNQCSSCMDGYLYDSASKTCSPCISPCKTCKTTTSTCSSCADFYVFNSASNTCVKSDCQVDKAAPFTLLSDFTCTSCNRKGLIKHSDTLCSDIQPPVFGGAKVQVDDSLRLTVNCYTANNIYFAYGIGNSALLSLLEIQELINYPKNNQNEYLRVGKRQNVANEEQVFLLNGIKYSGEIYQFKAFCESNGGNASAITNFQTLNTTHSESLILELNATTAINSLQKRLIAQEIGYILQSTKKIWVDDGSFIVPSRAVTGRFLQDESSSIARFFILPEYTLNEKDAIVETHKTYLVKNKDKFLNDLNNRLLEITLNNLNLFSYNTAAPTPYVNEETRQIVATSKGIKISFSQSTLGSFAVLYTKRNKLAVNETIAPIVSEIQLQKELANSGQQYSAVMVNIKNLTEPVVLSIENLTPNTTYNIYYYGENEGFPKVTTSIYHAIVRTSIISVIEADSAGILGFVWGVLILLTIIN